jgi:hypothetical protein
MKMIQGLFLNRIHSQRDQFAIIYGIKHPTLIFSPHAYADLPLSDYTPYWTEKTLDFTVFPLVPKKRLFFHLIITLVFSKICYLLVKGALQGESFRVNPHP